MRPVPALLWLAALSGCATADDGRFPSLAMRPAERVSGTLAPPPAPPIPTNVPEATTDSLAGLRRQALDANEAFRQRSASAAALTRTARGAAVASESWAVAQVALADLEAARSEAMIALADLDRLYVVASEAASATGGSAELDQVVRVRDEVTGLIAEQDRTLAALHASLGN